MGRKQTKIITEMIEVREAICLNCNWRWKPIKEKPKRCPSCLAVIVCEIEKKGRGISWMDNSNIKSPS